MPARVQAIQDLSTTREPVASTVAPPSSGEVVVPSQATPPAATTTAESDQTDWSPLAQARRLIQALASATPEQLAQALAQLTDSGVLQAIFQVGADPAMVGALLSDAPLPSTPLPDAPAGADAPNAPGASPGNVDSGPVPGAEPSAASSAQSTQENAPATAQAAVTPPASAPAESSAPASAPSNAAPQAPAVPAFMPMAFPSLAGAPGNLAGFTPTPEAGASANAPPSPAGASMSPVEALASAVNSPASAVEALALLARQIGEQLIATATNAEQGLQQGLRQAPQPFDAEALQETLTRLIATVSMAPESDAPDAIKAQQPAADAPLPLADGPRPASAGTTEFLAMSMAELFATARRLASTGVQAPLGDMRQAATQDEAQAIQTTATPSAAEPDAPEPDERPATASPAASSQGLAGAERGLIRFLIARLAPLVTPQGMRQLTRLQQALDGGARLARQGGDANTEAWSRPVVTTGDASKAAAPSPNASAMAEDPLNDLDPLQQATLSFERAPAAEVGGGQNDAAASLTRSIQAQIFTGPAIASIMAQLTRMGLTVSLTPAPSPPTGEAAVATLVVQWPSDLPAAMLDPGARQPSPPIDAPQATLTTTSQEKPLTPSPGTSPTDRQAPTDRQSSTERAPAQARQAPDAPGRADPRQPQDLPSRAETRPGAEARPQPVAQRPAPADADAPARDLATAALQASLDGLAAATQHVRADAPGTGPEARHAAADQPQRSDMPYPGTIGQASRNERKRGADRQGQAEGQAADDADAQAEAASLETPRRLALVPRPPAPLPVLMADAQAWRALVEGQVLVTPLAQAALPPPNTRPQNDQQSFLTAEVAEIKTQRSQS
jgi:hypothetical protein